MTQDNQPSYDAPETLGQYQEQVTGLGTIKIALEVVQNIATIAAEETKGVVGVNQGGINIFKSRDEVGVKVDQDDQERYVIDLHLVMVLGVKLHQVSHDVQMRVREEVENMTGNEVSQVNVFVEAVRRADRSTAEIERKQAAAAAAKALQVRD